MCSGFFTIEQLKHVSLHGSDAHKPIIMKGGLIEGGLIEGGSHLG